MEILLQKDNEHLIPGVPSFQLTLFPQAPACDLGAAGAGVHSHSHCLLAVSPCAIVSPLQFQFPHLVNLWLFIAVRNSLTISGLWCLHGVFDMYFNVS